MKWELQTQIIDYVKRIPRHRSSNSTNSEMLSGVDIIVCSHRNLSLEVVSLLDTSSSFGNLVSMTSFAVGKLIHKKHPTRALLSWRWVLDWEEVAEWIFKETKRRKEWGTLGLRNNPPMKDAKSEIEVKKVRGQYVFCCLQSASYIVILKKKGVCPIPYLTLNY